MTPVVFFDVLAGIFAIYFIVAMLFFFRYLYFKKGSLIKSILHIALSIVLVGGTIFVGLAYQNSVARNTPAPGTFTQEMKDTLDTKSPEECDFQEVSRIAMLANFPISAEDQAYIPKIKTYYVYNQISAAGQSRTEEEIAQEFDQLVANINS